MKRLFALCLSVLTVLSLCFPVYALTTPESHSTSEKQESKTLANNSARVIGSATITGNYVNVRTGPSTKYSVITQVNKGDRVGLLHFTKDEESDNYDDVWYYCVLSSTKQRGYIWWEYISPDPE